MRSGIALFLIISAGILAYSNSIGGDFIWDDVAFVIHNDFIKNIKAFPSYFSAKEALARGMLSGENYRPLLTLSYAIDYRFWKLDPFGYHLSNTFLHIANGILVFFLALTLTGKRLCGILCALFFVTHPIQTEAVTWISGRADVLFLFFYLSAFLAYVRYRKGAGGLLYAVSLLLFLCALLSKEMAASLPFVLIVYDFLYERDAAGRGRRSLAGRILGYGAFFMVLEIYVIARVNIIGRLAQCGYWTGDPYTTFLSMGRGIAYYVRLLIYPVGLCADYLTFPFAASLKEMPTVLSFSLLVLIIAGAFCAGRRHRAVSFSIGWFFITLGPALNIVPINILIAERFLYAPSIGYCILLALALQWVFDSSRKTGAFRYLSAGIGAAIVILYSVLTVARNDVWSDEIVFNKDILRTFPDNYRARLNLSVAYYNKGDTERSFKEAERALASSPDEYLSARKMIANYYMKKGMIDEAIGEYRHMIAVDPTSQRAHMFLAVAYERTGDYEAALREYRKAQALDREAMEPKIAIATLYIVMGDVATSIDTFKAILAEPPQHHYRSVYAAAHLRLGDLYMSTGDYAGARRAWQTVYREFGDQVWFSEISRYLTGVTTKKGFLSICEDWQPDFRIIAYYYIGMKSEMENDTGDARQYYRKVIDTATYGSGQVRLLARERLKRIEDAANE
jgi:tetratricopeptide (TPR) repeat protein